MENFATFPQSPKFSSRKRALITILSILIALCIIFFAIYISKPNSPKEEIIPVANNNGSVPTLRASIAQVNNYSKIKIPSYIIGKDLQEVPIIFQPFILSTASSLDIKSLSYSTGKQGYKIEYNINAKISDLSLELSHAAMSKEWEQLSEAYNLNAALIEFQYKTQSIRILVSRTETSGIVNITMFTVNN